MLITISGCSCNVAIGNWLGDFLALALNERTRMP